MVSVKSSIAAAAAVIISATAYLSTPAYAADMPMPQPQVVYQQVPCCYTGRWYLRGDVGVGVQTFSSFDHSQTNSVFVWPPSWQIVQKDIQDTAIFGFGIGYEWNAWLRFDVTGEYRTKAMFKATGSYTDFCPATAFGPGTCFDVNTGNLSSEVFLANAYVDLGTWWCITPFIGAGVGGARNQITGVQDNGIISNGTVGFGYTFNDSAQWNLAWDVQAGLTYNVNDNLKVDLSWRFLDLGSPQTAVVHCQNTNSCPGAFYTLRDITSQDFRVGLRWVFPAGGGFGFGSFGQSVFAAQPQYAPQPQYVPVQPQYAPVPPPQYVPAPPQQYGPQQYVPMQPPLSSRG
jgi:opacity protein-like surface antigen